MREIGLNFNKLHDLGTVNSNMNHVSAQALTTRRMTHLVTNNPPADAIDPVIVIKAYISNLVRTTRFWNNLHRVLPKQNNLKLKQMA
jgi:hypothetical protein